MPVYPKGTFVTEALWDRLISSTPASYTIHRIGNTYYAEANFSTGVDYSGTDIATVTQNAVNALSSGGRIHFRQGTYNFSTKITPLEDSGEFTRPLWITGDGWGTVLRKDGVTTPIFDFTGTASRVRNIALADLQLYSNFQTGELVRFVKADRIRLNNVLFWGGVNGSYAIYAEHSWDAVMNGCLFHGLGSATQPIITLYNGATNNCNNWRFLGCRWERNTTYNSLAFESDATGAGTQNHNIHFVACKIHGAAEDPAFTSGAISFKNTRFSSVADNTWITHHLGHIINSDADCEFNSFKDLCFYTTTGQGNPTSCIRIDGQLSIVENLRVHFAGATQVVLFDTNSNNNFVDADTILCGWGGATKVTDNGASNYYRAAHYV